MNPTSATNWNRSSTYKGSSQWHQNTPPKINDLNTQNNINSDVICLRDHEIESLTDQETNLYPKLKI